MADWCHILSFVAQPLPQLDFPLTAPWHSAAIQPGTVSVCTCAVCPWHGLFFGAGRLFVLPVVSCRHAIISLPARYMMVASCLQGSLCVADGLGRAATVHILLLPPGSTLLACGVGSGRCPCLPRCWYLPPVLVAFLLPRQSPCAAASVRVLPAAHQPPRLPEG
jgi:hypothetical protein